MELLYILLVLLICTRLLGEVAKRFGQPALVGEIIAGVAIGSLAAASTDSFPVLAHLGENEVFTAVTDLGVFFLMLLGGIEMRPRELTDAAGKSLGLALSGLLVPLGLGLALGWWLIPENPQRFAQVLFLGVALAITAVPVCIAVLMDMGLLHTRVGRLIVSAAVFDDVLSLVLLAVLTAVVGTGGMPSPGELVLLGGKIILFFAIAVPCGLYLFPVLGRVLGKMHAEEIELSGLLVLALAFALLSEALGMHFIIGAFFAGLFFVRQTIEPASYETISKTLSGMTHGFLAPLFFASVGLHLHLGAVLVAPVFLVLLIAVATVGKLAGAGIAARLSGCSNSEAAAVGIGMNARGAVELIVADIALRAGLFQGSDSPVISSIYSAIVIMAVVTTLATPIGLRLIIGDQAGEEADAGDENPDDRDPS